MYYIQAGPCGSVGPDFAHWLGWPSYDNLGDQLGGCLGIRRGLRARVSARLRLCSPATGQSPLHDGDRGQMGEGMLLRSVRVMECLSRRLLGSSLISWRHVEYMKKLMVPL